MNKSHLVFGFSSYRLGKLRPFATREDWKEDTFGVTVHKFVVGCLNLPASRVFPRPLENQHFMV